MAEMRLGILHRREDDIRTALEWHSRARDSLSCPEGADLLPSVWGNMGICYWDLLEGRQAKRYHRRAAEGFSAQFRRVEATRSFQNLAYVLIELGSWDEAASTLHSAERLSRPVPLIQRVPDRRCDAIRRVGRITHGSGHC